MFGGGDLGLALQYVMQQKHACLLQLKGSELKNSETIQNKNTCGCHAAQSDVTASCEQLSAKYNAKLADEKEEEEEAMFRGAYKSVNAIDVQYVNRQLPFSIKSGKITNDNANRIE